MITFYDLGGKPPIKTWSPNPWKPRYVLNFKKLPYKTVPLEYAEIKDVLRQAGVPSSGNRDGEPMYTVPAIVDDATGTAISDSFKIAEYLDKQYPDTPQVFPPGTIGLQAAFYEQFDKAFSVFVTLMMPNVPHLLTADSGEAYRQMGQKTMGKPFDQIRPVGAEFEKVWKDTKAFFDSMDQWYGKSAGPYLMGSTPVFVDFQVGSFLISLRMINGEDSDEWKKISTWHDNRWLKLAKNLEQYADVEL